MRVCDGGKAGNDVYAMPLRRLKLPQGAVGRDYILVPLMIGGEGPFEFMLDSGLTGTIVTPSLCERLGIDASKGNQVRGTAAGGEADVQVVQINDATLEDGSPLDPLHAAVTDFVQERLDPEHNVQGMVGVEFFRQFDVEIDFEQEMLRLYKPGKGMQYAQRVGMKEMQGALLPAELIGVRASLEGGAPFLGIVDLGASFTTVNWKAAVSGGLDPKDPRLDQAPKVYGLGVDGRPIVMPQVGMQMSLDGAMDEKLGRFPAVIDFATTPICVGDISVFQDLLSPPGQTFNRAAGLIGLDVLSQCKCLLITCKNWRLYFLG